MTCDSLLKMIFWIVIFMVWCFFWQKTNQYPLQAGDDDLDVSNGDQRKLKKFIRTH